MSVSLTTRAGALSPVRPRDPELLTREEAASYLGVSVSSLAHWSMSGSGPVFVKLGKRSWYRRSTLDAWIERQVPDRMRAEK